MEFPAVLNFEWENLDGVSQIFPKTFVAASS